MVSSRSVVTVAVALLASTILGPSARAGDEPAAPAPRERKPVPKIENAFLDKKRDVLPESDDLTVAIPSLTDYLIKKEQSNGQVVAPFESERPVA